MNIRRTILINSETQNLKRKETKVIEDENFLRPVFADRNSESKKVKDFFSLFFFFEDNILEKDDSLSRSGTDVSGWLAFCSIWFLMSRRKAEEKKGGKNSGLAVRAGERGQGREKWLGSFACTIPIEIYHS